MYNDLHLASASAIRANAVFSLVSGPVPAIALQKKCYHLLPTVKPT